MSYSSTRTLRPAVRAHHPETRLVMEMSRGAKPSPAMAVPLSVTVASPSGNWFEASSCVATTASGVRCIRRRENQARWVFRPMNLDWLDQAVLVGVGGRGGA
ncbi:hypothetical protein Rhow_003788 [Rhodococcus wratislaviensis]|uniref:Uncharacterized protein n=1 Tax=Rhodococcus wratislaviensis TaxID=44752 RepID=A0A402C948_RHOWR|nr:hypothetical protein Rhow_003788 [Rhodococcus wratislaviensis]